MTQQRISWAPFIFGGIFVGAWLYGLLFGFPGWGDFSIWQWLLWGFLGLVIAGGIYAALITHEWVRIALVTTVGLAIGLLIMAIIMEEEVHIIATFLNTLGAGLIAAGLPRPGDEDTTGQEWVEVRPKGAPAKKR